MGALRSPIEVALRFGRCCRECEASTPSKPSGAAEGRPLIAAEWTGLVGAVHSLIGRCSAPSCDASVECAVDYIHNFASGHIDQKQVGSIAHPFKAWLWRRQAKGGPVTVVISRREQHRRQYSADHPAPVAPAAWIDERCDANRVKWTTVI